MSFKAARACKNKTHKSALLLQRRNVTKLSSYNCIRGWDMWTLSAEMWIVNSLILWATASHCNQNNQTKYSVIDIILNSCLRGWTQKLNCKAMMIWLVWLCVTFHNSNHTLDQIILNFMLPSEKYFKIRNFSPFIFQDSITSWSSRNIMLNVLIIKDEREKLKNNKFLCLHHLQLQ